MGTAIDQGYAPTPHAACNSIFPFPRIYVNIFLPTEMKAMWQYALDFIILGLPTPNPPLVANTKLD
jgi:hypothetical protein